MSKITDKIFKNEEHYLTSSFGNRNSIETPNGQTYDFHTGSDYGTNGKKLAQYALEEGKIIEAGTDNYGAKYVIINYPRLNVNMTHKHLDSINVKENDNVNNNTIIGYTGSTGLATGIHLHLAIYDLSLKEYVDPEIYAVSYKEKVVALDDDYVTYKIGDNVIVNGTLHSNSYGGKKGKTLKNYTGKITHINLKGTKPYHIDKLGWVTKDSIKNTNEVLTYKVVKGDNLTKIAKRFNTTWKIIYDDNKDIIKDPNLIKPGMVLKIK